MASLSQLNESTELSDTEQFKRKRYSLKSINHLLRDSEDETESEESSDESEDDWDADKKRKSRNIKKKIPEKTVKKKLAEKTKTLRKSIKQNNLCSEKSENVTKMKETTVETTPDTKPKLPLTDTLPDVVPVVKETPETIPKEAPVTTPVETPVPKKENIVKEEGNKKEIIKKEVTVPVKQDTTVEFSEDPDIIILDDDPPLKKIEPVVLTYSTSKNSSNISPFLVTTRPENTNTTVTANVNHIASSNASSLQSCVTTSTVTTTSPSSSTGIGRLRINPNLQSPRMFSNPAPMISPVPASPRTRTRTPSQRTPRSVPTSPAVNTSFRPRRLFSNNTNSSSRNTPQRITPSVSKVPVPSLKNPGSLNRISPRGTIIYNGSNSVTITPRKKSPERRPVQRQLIKTDVEGIIAARVENGVLKYVLNLANGTHLPLTNLQVSKLREQNNGVLPSKLKIPVPSDVACQIEPRFVIDD